MVDFVALLVFMALHYCCMVGMVVFECLDGGMGFVLFWFRLFDGVVVCLLFSVLVMINWLCCLLWYLCFVCCLVWVGCFVGWFGFWVELVLIVLVFGWVGCLGIVGCFGVLSGFDVIGFGLVCLFFVLFS